MHSLVNFPLHQTSKIHKILNRIFCENHRVKFNYVQFSLFMIFINTLRTVYNKSKLHTSGNSCACAPCHRLP